MSELTRRGARRKLATMRLASFIITVGLLSALIHFGSPIVWAYVVMIGLIILPLPIGGVMSVFTVWSGYGVSSCPNCPSFSFEEIKIRRLQCDCCGDVEHQVGMSAYGWIHRGADERLSFCSWDCRNEFDEQEARIE